MKPQIALYEGASRTLLPVEPAEEKSLEAIWEGYALQTGEPAGRRDREVAHLATLLDPSQAQNYGGLIYTNPDLSIHTEVTDLGRSGIGLVVSGL